MGSFQTDPLQPPLSVSFWNTLRSSFSTQSQNVLFAGEARAQPAATSHILVPRVLWLGDVQQDGQVSRLVTDRYTSVPPDLFPQGDL